jgi:glycosyltransferase involved in cell wall biosynthesis
MKISVICVCYNSEDTIRHTIESFLSQDHQSKELIVVDGQSTDKTLDIVRSFASKDIQCVSGPDNGIYDAMNKGFGRFTGDIFGFLNSDDCFKDDSVLSEISSKLEHCDIVAGNIVFVTDHIKKRVIREWNSTIFKPGAFKNGWAQPHPAVYARREVAEAVGKFDTSYQNAADYDWLLRAYEIHSFDGQIVDKVFVEMKIGGASTSGMKALWVNATETLKSRQKWLGAGVIDYAFFAKYIIRFKQLRQKAHHRS